MIVALFYISPSLEKVSHQLIVYRGIDNWCIQCQSANRTLFERQAVHIIVYKFQEAYINVVLCVDDHQCKP